MQYLACVKLGVNTEFVLGLPEDIRRVFEQQKNHLRDIASLRINLSLKTVQLSPLIFGQFCEYIILLFCP